MPEHSWKALVAKYQHARPARAIWQLVNSVGGYLACWGLMVWTMSIAWWLTLPVALLAGVLLVRVFIIFHDCGHGSFFASRRWNNFWGFVTGILVLTPYAQWRATHAFHHGANGNLDKRGTGDVWTLTVREYTAAPWWKRLSYRLVRHPAVLILVAPIVLFVFQQRFVHPGSNARERRSVWITTACVLGWGTGMTFVFGLLPYLILHLGIIAVTGAIGVWLFYSQHQFEDTYWERGESWSYEDAALRGSAFLRLPRVLQWCTGNIGFHHIHHLNSRIPNYNLQACHEADPAFQGVTSVSLFRSLRALGLKLWDEASGKLIGFRQLSRQRRRGAA